MNIKKTIIVVFINIFFIITINGATNCHFVKYNVQIINKKALNERKIYITDDFLRIDDSALKYTIFSLKEKVSYSVDLSSKVAEKHIFFARSPFYLRYIVNFGVLSNNDKLVIPEVVFRKTGIFEKINGEDCFQVKLPGTFLNSTTYLWFGVMVKIDKGKYYKKYISCFSDNKKLRNKAKAIGGFPLMVVTTLNINTRIFKKKSILVEENDIVVEDSFFKLPKEIEIKLVKD